LSQDTYKSTASRCGSTRDDALRFPQFPPSTKRPATAARSASATRAPCTDFITLAGTSPGIVGDGIIDGQGGEPLIGKDYSWWQASYALRAIDGSIGNPTLINSSTGTTGLLLYRITLHNSPKFHVKITSYPADGTARLLARVPSSGASPFSRLRNGQQSGDVLTPSFARNNRWHRPRRGNCGPVRVMHAAQ